MCGAEQLRQDDRARATGSRGSFAGGERRECAGSCEGFAGAEEGSGRRGGRGRHARVGEGAAASGTSAQSTDPSASTSPGVVDVVAAENFYGDMVSQIGGSHVSVTSILSSPDADPHLFEPGSQTGLAVATAKLVIVNGVGYDAFMDKLIAATPNSHRTVVNVADALGVRGHDANPHLWYDVPHLPQIVAAITDGLIEADPANKSVYVAGQQRFLDALKPLQTAVAELGQRYSSSRVASTEPVAGYLLDAAGLVEETPDSFSQAIENGVEPSPQAVAAMRSLFAGRQVKVLLYNTQTQDSVTLDIKALATANGIPVVGVSETMPAGADFQTWQLDQVRALSRALGS